MEEQKKLISLQKALGKRIKAERQKQKISTIEMSRRCLMDSGNYVRIEQGKVNITLKTILKISQALDLKLKVLFDL